MMNLQVLKQKQQRDIEKLVLDGVGSTARRDVQYQGVRLTRDSILNHLEALNLSHLRARALAVAKDAVSFYYRQGWDMTEFQARHMPIKPLDSIRLLANLPNSGFRAGRLGTVLAIEYEQHECVGNTLSSEKHDRCPACHRTQPPEWYRVEIPHRVDAPVRGVVKLKREQFEGCGQSFWQRWT